MSRTILVYAALAHCAVAFHMPMPASRTAVRNHRGASISMVLWDSVPGDTQWTKTAWEAMGLDAGNLLHACVQIPDQYVPDQGFKRSRTWYFCTSTGVAKAGME